MHELISPKYIMSLIDIVDKAIWTEFSSYKKVLLYIARWHEDDWNFWENFRIVFKNNWPKEEIDLSLTLHNMPWDLVIKIAIDLWIETPDFIPTVTLFKNDLKENYKTAFNSFDKALKQVEENPDLAVGLANSTLESIIKHILKDKNITTKADNKKTLYDLTCEILKEFKMFPNKEIQEEIKCIWSSLLNISQNIEKLRSEKTAFHWKTSEDYLINDPLYAYFIVNSVSTVGLFLMAFYKKKYLKTVEKVQEEEIGIEDIPF